MSGWELATVAVKFLGLCGAAGVIGGAFMLILPRFAIEHVIRFRLATYILVSAFIGLMAASLFFLIQIGAVNDAGLNGMLDTQMIGIFASSALGTATGLRMLACTAAIGAAAVLRLRPANDADAGRQYWTMICLGVCSLLLGYSFQLTGHVAVLEPAARVAIVVHVIAIFAWTGSLIPLCFHLNMYDKRAVQTLLTRFGSVAASILSALLVSGIYLAVQLIGSVDLLFTTLYGQMMLLKLTGVTALLAIAALNKFILVPRVGDTRYMDILKYSISVEIIAALFVLGITTYLTAAVELPQ